MRRWGWCLLLSGCALQSAAPPKAANLPSLDVLDLDGHALPLAAAVGGSITVVDLWATWCAACEQERPKLERLSAAFAQRGVRVLGVNVGEDAGVVSAHLAENPVSYPIYLDPDFRVADALGERRLPAILIVSKDGRITYRSQSLDERALDQLRSLLAEASR